MLRNRQLQDVIICGDFCTLTFDKSHSVQMVIFFPNTNMPMALDFLQRASDSFVEEESTDCRPGRIRPVHVYELETCHISN